MRIIEKRLFYYPSLLNSLCLLANRMVSFRSIIGNCWLTSRPATIRPTKHFKHMKRWHTFKCYTWQNMTPIAKCTRSHIYIYIYIYIYIAFSIIFRFWHLRTPLSAVIQGIVFAQGDKVPRSPILYTINSREPSIDPWEMLQASANVPNEPLTVGNIGVGSVWYVWKHSRASIALTMSL